MKQQKSLLSNTFKSALSSFSTLFLFVLLILSGRFLDAEDFGRYSFAMAFVFLFDPIMDPGLYHLLIREIARRKEDAKKYIAHALTWKLLLAPFVFLLIAIAVNIIHHDPKTIQAVYLMAIASFLKSFKDAFRTSLIANEYFGLNTTSILIERILLLIFGGLVLITGKGLLWLCWVFVLTRVVDLLITALFVQYSVCDISLGYDFKFVKRLIISAVPVGAFYITLNIYNYVDTVMLSIIRTNTEVGWYNASYKIYEGLFIFPGILCTVFMPRLSLLYNQSGESFKNLFISGLKYVFSLALVISVNGLLLSENIIINFYGNSFMKSVASMNILLVGLLFVFSLTFMHMAMITMYKQRIILLLAIFGLLLNIILNLFLIPYYGYLGAAFATVTVEFLLFLILIIYLYKIIKIKECFYILWKCLISSIVPALAIMSIFPKASIYLKFILLNIGIVVLLYKLEVFEKKEINTLTDYIFLRKKVEHSS